MLTAELREELTRQFANTDLSQRVRRSAIEGFVGLGGGSLDVGGAGAVVETGLPAAVVGESGGSDRGDGFAAFWQT